MSLGMGRYHQDLKIAAPYCPFYYTSDNWQLRSRLGYPDFDVILMKVLTLIQ